MTNENDNRSEDASGEKGREADAARKKTGTRETRRRDADQDNLGAALRNAYQSTVDEGVPDDFKDLIDKLK